MAEAAVTCLLEQLKEVVVGYADLIIGAEEEFDQLQRDLESLKAFLKVTAKKTRNDHPFRMLERRIRDVVYEVEDAIDTCLTNEMEEKPESFIRRHLGSENISLAKSFIRGRFGTKTLNHAKSFVRRRLGLKTVSLAKEVKSITEDKVRPLLNDVKNPQKSGEGPSINSKRDKPIRQNIVIGFDEEEATITGYLKEKTDKLDVMSLVGLPGQGKTTLAWKIYQNETICYHFPIRIWVYISQVFNSRDVFLQILKKFMPSQDTSSLNDDELAQTVRVCLAKEKFLLVLDDVWSVDTWNQIKEVLPLDNVEAKVLITSRQINVGENFRVYRDHHKLKFLTDDESWRLLQYEVFGNLEDCPQELSNIGCKIAKKCDGVPLTIVVMECILADQLKRSPSSAVSEWEMILTNVSGALQDDKTQRITDVVELSYQTLPDGLRECFVFLGVFPEHYEIPAKMLCGLWIVEGFVLSRKGRSMEESAEDNMNDLVCRNLLKVERTNHMGKVKTCRVHRMIRAFCINRSNEENSWQEIKISKTGEFEPSISEVQKSRRLCFRLDLSKFLSANPSGPHVRSFLYFNDRPVELEPQHISLIPEAFKKLRILESKCIKLDQFPAKVTKLIHLRYLTLYIDTLEIIPEAITQLWNLQSLVVETKSRSVTMKANMWRMVRFRYLKTRAAIVLDDKWEGEAGQNLHTLNRLAPESCTEAVSRRAKNLKTLGISGKLASFYKNNFLEKLLHLEKLKLVNSTSYEPTSEGMLQDLPVRNCFPPNLKRLTLTNTFLGWKHMSTLAMIKSLEVLKLKDNAFVGVSWNVDGYNFPSLQLLLMVNADLVLWNASTDSFPRLRFLVVKNCENLRDNPVLYLNFVPVFFYVIEQSS